MNNKPSSTLPGGIEPAIVQGKINRKAAEVAIRNFIEALGVDVSGETMRRTPARLVDAYIEFLTPRPFAPTSFPNHGSYDEIVYVEGIYFRSLCEHHLLPFTGRACIGYVPDSRLLGLSKLARAVELLACRPQVQERLTVQIADWVAEHSRASGVGVVVKAEHSCMTLRGAKASGAMMTTSAFRGVLGVDGHLRREFVELSLAVPRYCSHGERGNADRGDEGAAWT